MKKCFIIIFSIFLLTSSVLAKEEKPYKYEGMGYVGTLPDVSRCFTPSETQLVKPPIIQVENFYSANQMKPIPRDNPTFVNIMLKKDKTSQYINDLNDFIPLLEKIYDSIEDKENVQLFNAKIYYFNKSAEYFYNKYIEKPEGQYISFQKLVELSSRAKSIALLRSEAQKYNPYLAYTGSGYIYDPSNIENQLIYLQKEVEKTIYLLKDAD